MMPSRHINLAIKCHQMCKMLQLVCAADPPVSPSPWQHRTQLDHLESSKATPGSKQAFLSKSIFCCNFLGKLNSNFKTHFPSWKIEQFGVTQLQCNPKQQKTANTQAISLKPQGWLRPCFTTTTECSYVEPRAKMCYVRQLVTSSDGLGRLKSTSPLSLSGGSSR